MAGQLWLCGLGTQGASGDNTATSKSSPVQTIAGGNDWVSVSAGLFLLGQIRAGIKTDGTLWIWGTATNGGLGNGYSSGNKSSPVQTITGGNNWSQVSCGYQSSAAIKTDGTLWIWGRNNRGQLGDNSITYKSSPIQTICRGNNWKYVSCGSNYAAAIKTDGTLWMWGDNTSGQLGNNTVIHRSSPVQTVAGGNNWATVRCVGSITAALKKDGTLWCWGLNTDGSLGDNTTVNRSSPVQTIAFGTDWILADCQFGLKKDGTLWGWGTNTQGQLGDNTTIHRSSPVQVYGSANTWTSVSYATHTTATKSDGTLWCWGNNQYGGLGDNTTTHRSSPVQTVAFGTRWSVQTTGTGAFIAIYENDSNQLGVNTQPVVGYNSNQLLVQPKININDSAGSLVRIATNSVTVAVQSGTATLSGTTTVAAVAGVATFTDLVLTGSGNVTLRFTSSGLTLVDSSSFTVSLTLPIIPKRSEVSGKLPTSGQLNIGELAVNIADKKGYVKKSDGTIVNLFNGAVYDGGTF